MSEEKNRKKSFLILREDFFDNTVGRDDYNKRRDRIVVVKNLPREVTEKNKDDDEER